MQEVHGRIFVGMSGFSYPGWRGGFYPERLRANEMLPYYATRFGAVEINATYRRMPTVDLVARWRDAVPHDFRFALKASQRITHLKRLHDVREEIEVFVRETEGLEGRRAAVLFQVPANLEFDRDRVGRFLALLPSGARYAFEPRHESYGTDAFHELLERHAVAHCLNDGYFDVGSYRRTATFAYLRLRKGEYTSDELRERADVARRLAGGGADVYVFFMHEEDPRAPLQALRFQELVRG